MEYYVPKTAMPTHAPYFRINRKTKTVIVGSYYINPVNGISLYGHRFVSFNDLLYNLHLFTQCDINTHPELFI